MGVFHGSLDVDHGQDEQDEGLQHLAEQEQEVHGHRAEKHADVDARTEAEEDDERHFFGEDVAEKTQRHGKRTGQMGNDLNGEHQRNQRLAGTREVVDIPESPGTDAHIVVIDEHAQRDGDGGVQIGGGGVAAGHEAQQVHGQHIDEDGGQQGHIAAALLLAEVGKDELLQSVHENLEKELKTAGNSADVSAEHKPGDKQNGHAEPGEEHILGLDGHARDRDFIHVENGRKQKRVRQSRCSHGNLLYVPRLFSTGISEMPV